MSNYVIERLLTLFLAGLAVWLLASLFMWLTFTSIKSYHEIQYNKELHEARLNLLNAESKESEALEISHDKLLKALE